MHKFNQNNLIDWYFSQSAASADSAELFVNCLEAMVETCLPGDDGDDTEGEGIDYAGSLNSSVAINLSNSLSSLSVGSPTEKNSSNDFDLARRHMDNQKRSSSFKQKPTSKNGGKPHEL